MSAAQQDAGADDLLAQLQPRDMAALRCRGKCFIEMEATTSVDVAVTAFHMIFLISHQGTRTSRLAWSDVANMHLSVNQGRHCAIIEFFVHKPKSAAHKPAVSSPKLTKVAQMIQADTTAKEADASSRVLKQIFAQKSVVEKMADETLAAKPLTFYIEDTRVDDNERSIVIASQRAFMYFLFHKQTQISLSTKSLVYDEPDLLKQYSALENDVAAALSNEELLPLLEDLEDGARHHTIKYTFMHRPLILNRLTKELSSFRMRPALSRQDGPTLPSLLSSKLNIRVATAAFRCISAIACDAYSLFNKEDAVATSAAEQCLLAAVAPVTSDVEMSDDRMRVALSALLQAQVESVFNCLFLCFRTPSPSLIPFLSAHLTPEQVSAFVSSAVYEFILPVLLIFISHNVSRLPCHPGTLYCAQPPSCLMPNTRVILRQVVQVLQSLTFLPLQSRPKQQQQQYLQ